MNDETGNEHEQHEQTQEQAQAHEAHEPNELEQDIPPSPEPSHGVAPWRTALPVTKTVPVQEPEGSEGSHD